MVTRKEIKAFVQQVVQRFRPGKVILFGSYAYGRPNEDSDVDLMVIMRHHGSGPSKATEIRLACPHQFAMDLLVRTPAEVRHRMSMGDQFVNEVIGRGIVLYEDRNT